MKRNLLLFAFGLVGSGAAVAQEAAPTPVAEVGINYSYITTMPGGGASSFGSQGGSGAFVYNINRVIGVVADLGGYYNAAAANSSPTTFSYLFGPRLSLRKSSKFTPYVQALFGGDRVSTSLVNANTGSSIVQNGFAAAFGGGLDVRLTDHLAVKPFQIEYLMTQAPNDWSLNNPRNNIRYSAGVVFRLGAK
ncbi:MAG: outer membrane beta-barrel protein [Acidobacteriota bacterium]|nr:outer membrane beta-barrel protein [Acidobacteriota bacterium]